ncbi:hypothetical protein F4556_002347 [Kitasatospora gansuensis]|uniref:Uncharacterized protein n=1 Tax=Kitasatospora gansuensis TaxID=258050 RepID=A0A7W7WGH4_9ACTN|nr:hypothetical protein [Kitasatospora gansuensis]MBB4946812.1 hypothetical protein [Kitasatospora gansuensis]
MEWINPKYAELVADYRMPIDPDMTPISPMARPDGEPVAPVRGFIMEPLAD